MQIREYAVTMAAYNAWMNERLYAAAAELTDEERKRDLNAAFKSIHGTLNHLLLADRSWLERFRGEPVTMKSPDQELYADFEQLRAARAAMDAEITAWAEEITEEWAEAPFHFRSVSYNREWTRPAWVLVTHLFNHQAHHRGQVTTLLKQAGYEPGVTDLIAMLRD